MFNATAISVRVNGKPLVDRVSLTLEPGKVLAVAGPNGAGKSTLLRALCGEIAIASGQIRLNGRNLAGWSAREQARLRAVLPQSSTLPFAFRVSEVVLMGRTPQINGVERPHDYEIACNALATVAMSDFAERTYTALSGGEQQRVQLARVLAQIWDESPFGPRYLLLDEPTSNLDLAHQHRILQIARRFAGQGVGVLAILHDLNLAAQYADTVLVMKGGQGFALGSPHNIFTPALIEEAFATAVVVIPHPCLNCPLIVANMTLEDSPESLVLRQLDGDG